MATQARVRHHGSVHGGRRSPLLVILAAWMGVSVGAAGCQPATVLPSADPRASASAAPAGPTASASAAPSFVRPTPNPSPTFLVHEVRSGESLTAVARLYGTTARSIAYWNRDRYPSLDPDSDAYEPDRIEVGWTLRLIPTEVVDEDELPAATPPSPSPSASAPPS